MGMGAFLRHISRNDPAYALPDMIAQLRFRIAQELVAAARTYAARTERPMRLHICVQGGAEGGEAEQNKEALTLAFSECGLSRDQWSIHLDKDATMLATELARRWWQDQSASASPSAVAPVSLANAA